MADAVITVRGLRKSYGPVDAVRGVDLDVAQGEVYAVNGTYEPTPVGVATTPSLDEAAALQTVVGDLEARGQWAPVPDDVAAWLGVEEAQTELVLYPDPEQGLRLAYDVSLHPNLLEWYTYLIDAQTGRILNRIARHCTLHYHPAASAPVRVSGLKLPEPSASPARGSFVDGSATDLNGQTQNLRVYLHDDGFFYNIWDLPNLNVAASELPNEPDGGALTISANDTDFDDDINLTHVTSGDNTWDDPVSVSAHVNMNLVYTYYKDTHDRDAIDGKDQSMISVIHVTDEGRPMDNAFWNGRLMAYGDGEQAFLPLAGALDVAAHEVTHGVIENTAGLLYQSQSGALNESFADVFGVMVEPEDFLLGEDIMRTGAVALRDLLNPDNPQVLARQPAHMSQFQNLSADQDNGGVHVNSGIPNRAAALIMQIIGVEPTEQIYYRALTTYLTRNSQFGDARNALEQSAIDLFPQNPSIALAVRQSFDEVGIFATSGMDNEEGNDLPPQTGGESLIAFMLEDGSIGLLNLTDPETPMASTFNDPAAVARVDAESGNRSQLSTPLNGETIYFINPDKKLALIQVESGLVSVFDDLFIDQEGDLWNASVSPNEDFVAMVSAYDNDPTLYIFDGENLGRIDLKPETTQEGVLDETIRFPDVVSWSPNPQLPRIVFDALNEVDFVGESTISYWSIYEIDFAAGSILNLIPAQPTEISLGNITYSNTDPDRVAFNTIDDTNTWDVLIGDFA
ncbi:MAG: M4 family metallopeptidase, partial [Bacteroidetes bacterium]|nr:M4 family metallopeptidase [Bacteroidota bacterium]